MPRPVYIKSCGVIPLSGEVRDCKPENGSFDAWYAHEETDDYGSLQELHHPGGGQHSTEVIELCNRLTMSGPESDTTLLYVHRGHHRPSKTPLLQMLLARLNPRLRVHGLRVEETRLPLDVVLLAVATLAESAQCLIVKDNALRFGTAGVVSPRDARYLMLSASNGRWAVESIAVFDEEPAFENRPAQLLLDEFSTEDKGCDRSVSLATRTSTNRLGIIDLVRV